MKISSEQEMLAFGTDFAKHLITGNLNSVIRDISRPTGSELARSPVTDRRRSRAKEKLASLSEATTGGRLQSTGATKRVENGTIKLPLVLELIGDVGAGKTTFVRGLAEGLGIKEPITSPSFTISKQYALPDGRRLIHYDFYRLPDPGLMSEDLRENLEDPNNIVIIEWGESIADLLPKNHTIIKIDYTDSGDRILSF